ncbi:hypothetical protein [Kitasatospora sp. MAP5-34]|uniref:hypothetical protein n=1 Tax=Kitasatospora sp. MAP5-34 TaxID=3035102 RepID=UPI0024765BFE|nr:hypothetical protein [Kitasatospora sp. MAP5-34]
MTAERLSDAWEADLAPDPAPELLLGLLRNQTPACAPARAALLAGGTGRINDRVQPADQHANIYTGRIEHTRANGIETIGLPEGVSALRALGDRPVRLAAIDSPDHCWHFVLFVAADGGSLVGCAGVRRSGAAA